MVAGGLYLLVAAGLAVVGRGIGGCLARGNPGLLVICWALVVSPPALVPFGWWLWSTVDWGASTKSWACFACVTVTGQFLGFFVRCRGSTLAGRSGPCRSGPAPADLFTLAAGAALLGEQVDPTTLGFGLLTLLFVWLARGERITRRS